MDDICCMRINSRIFEIPEDKRKIGIYFQKQIIIVIRNKNIDNSIMKIYYSLNVEEEVIRLNLMMTN